MSTTPSPPTLPASLLKPPTPDAQHFRHPLASPTPWARPPSAHQNPPQSLAATITLASDAINNQGGNDDQPVTNPRLFRPRSPPAAPRPRPFVNCTVDLNISEPANGSAVGGVINFTGTADTPILPLIAWKPTARKQTALGLRC
ncbi:MAG: hypothetical protein M5U34_07390 [Chloroflexi bacterium]|nr:hypothetical protein [Chloroflexota bacterium]